MAKSKTTTTRVAVMGAGEVAPKKLRATMMDFMADKAEDNGGITFLIPMIKDEWNDSLAAVVDYLIQEEFPYEVMVEAGATRTRAFKPYLQNATEVIERQRGLLQGLIRRLGEADESIFLALYTDDDEVLEMTLTKALDAGYKVYDLADSLAELGSDGAPPMAAEEEEDDEMEDAPTAPTKARKGAETSTTPQTTPDVDTLVDMVLKRLAERLVSA